MVPVQAKTYLNYDLSIRLDESGALEVAVLDSPAGEAHESHQWPFSEQDLEIFLLRIGHTRRGVRKIDSPEMEAARDFGERLYDAVFSGQIGTSFERSLDEAERQGQGLRLRLRTDDTPELSDVPWEYLYSTPLHRFLTISTATPLVHYLEQPRLIPPLVVEEAVRILTMVSSPTDVAELDVEDEWARINESLSDLASSGLIDLRRLPEATMGALQRELRQRPYHVFHFIGHGAFDAAGDEGVLMFEDDRRRGHKVSGEHLGTILHDHESLRLVVLNSCEGARPSPQDPFAGTAQGLVRQGIPAVIGMQFEITDDAAITFSRDFYSAIADGFPVDAALAEARKAIFTSGNDVEWGTPVLHMRTPDGRIFDRTQPIAPPQPEEADDLSVRLAEAERVLLESDFERAVVQLESIVHDHPRATVAADKLAAAKRLLRAERLYASVRILFQAEQWQAVVDRFVEVRALDPDFQDREDLLPHAQEALAEQKRDARLDLLYREAETAMAARDWNEATRILGLISAEDVEYRNVSKLLEEASAWHDAGTLHAAAQEAFESEDWHAVISRFDELRLLGPDYSDDPDDLESRARARLDEEEQRRRLQAEYDAAIALVEEEKWQDSIQILDKISAEQPDYPGIDKLRDTIREQARKQEVGQIQLRAAILYAEAEDHAVQEHWDKVIDTLDQLDRLAPNYPGAEPLRERAQTRLPTAPPPHEATEALTDAPAGATTEDVVPQTKPDLGEPPQVPAAPATAPAVSTGAEQAGRDLLKTVRRKAPVWSLGILAIASAYLPWAIGGFGVLTAVNVPMSFLVGFGRGVPVALALPILILGLVIAVRGGGAESGVLRRSAGIGLAVVVLWYAIADEGFIGITDVLKSPGPYLALAVGAVASFPDPLLLATRDAPTESAGVAGFRGFTLAVAAAGTVLVLVGLPLQWFSDHHNAFQVNAGAAFGIGLAVDWGTLFTSIGTVVLVVLVIGLVIARIRRRDITRALPLVGAVVLWVVAGWWFAVPGFAVPGSGHDEVGAGFWITLAGAIVLLSVVPVARRFARRRAPEPGGLAQS